MQNLRWKFFFTVVQFSENCENKVGANLDAICWHVDVNYLVRQTVTDYLTAVINVSEINEKLKDDYQKVKKCLRTLVTITFFIICK